MAIQVGLNNDDIEEVRVRTIRWAAESCLSYGQVAVIAHLSRNQVCDFLGGRRGSEEVVAHLVTYLPLDLAYQSSKILPA